MPFLTGQYYHTIDAKSRLTIPAKLREVINPAEEGYGFVAIMGPDAVLSLYTPAAYRRIAPQFDPRSQASPDVRNFRRLAYALADQLEVDRLGRILIPETTAKRCGLTKDVVIIGVEDHIEVWPRDRWEGFLNEQMANQDALAERAMALGQQAPPPDESA